MYCQNRMATDWKPEVGGGEVSSNVPGLQGLSPYALDPTYLPKAPEFIFPVETRQRSWNEKWFDRVGTSYMIGLGIGGMWGLHEGIRNPEGTTPRMRANSVLNGLTRRGPFMANTLAVLTLVYSPMESCIGHLRGKRDVGNSMVAAAITGALYKSTAGTRAMGIAAGAGCLFIGALHLGKVLLGETDIPILDYT